MLALFLLQSFTVGPVRADNNLDELIRKTKKQLSQQKKREKSVMNSLLSSQRTLDKSEKKLESITRRLRQTQTNIDATRAALKNLEHNLVDLEKKQAARRENLNKRLVALYKYGFDGYIQVFIDTKNFAEFVSRFEAMAYYLENDLAAIKGLSSDRRRIQTKQAEIARKQELLEYEEQRYAQLQQQAEEEKKKYVKYVEQSEKLLASIQEDRKRLEAALAEYERTSREIAREIRRSQKTGGARLGTGQMIWPVRGRISSPFGSRYHPVLKRKKFHNGIDIAAPMGTPLLAADGGVVLVSGWRGGYGNYLVIDHGAGISTAYGHNSRLLVKEGETVVRGQRIALIGSTGLSTGPHVHFEVRINGQPTNPMNYLP